MATLKVGRRSPRGRGCRRPSHVIHRPSTGRPQGCPPAPANPACKLHRSTTAAGVGPVRILPDDPSPAPGRFVPIWNRLAPAAIGLTGRRFVLSTLAGRGSVGPPYLRPQATGRVPLRSLRSHLLGAGRVKRRPRPAACIRSHRGASARGVSRPPGRRKKTPSRGPARFDPLAVPRSSKKRDRKFFPKSTLFERFCATARSGRRSRPSRRSIQARPVPRARSCSPAAVAILATATQSQGALVFAPVFMKSNAGCIAR